MNLKTVIAILWISALAATSLGQGMRGTMGNPAAFPAVLLQRDDVRTELQITDDQKSKLYDMQQGLVSRFSELYRVTDEIERRKAVENIMKKIGEDVNKILTTGQQSRLKEISIQLAGFSSATQPDVQKSLTVTADQKAKIDDLNARQQKATTEAWEKLRNGEIQYADIQDTMKKNQKILNDEIGKILTAAQKEKLKTLGGKVFVPTPEPGSGIGA